MSLDGRQEGDNLHQLHRENKSVHVIIAETQTHQVSTSSFHISILPVAVPSVVVDTVAITG